MTARPPPPAPSKKLAFFGVGEMDNEQLSAHIARIVGYEPSDIYKVNDDLTFVTLESIPDARRVKQSMSGKIINGKRVGVEFKRPKPKSKAKHAPKSATKPAPHPEPKPAPHPAPKPGPVPPPKRCHVTVYVGDEKPVEKTITEETTLLNLAVEMGLDETWQAHVVDIDPTTPGSKTLVGLVPNDEPLWCLGIGGTCISFTESHK